MSLVLITVVFNIFKTISSQMQEQASKLTPQQREELQKLQQSGELPMKNMGENMSEDERIEYICKLVKTNPALFKSMMKSGMMSGLPDSQIDSYIDQLSKMEPDTLRSVISSTTWASTYLKPLQEYYKKVVTNFQFECVIRTLSVSNNCILQFNQVDNATYGCAKYILGFIAMILMYYIFTFVWWLLRIMWRFFGGMLAAITGANKGISGAPVEVTVQDGIPSETPDSKASIDDLFEF